MVTGIFWKIAGNVRSRKFFILFEKVLNLNLSLNFK